MTPTKIASVSFTILAMLLAAVARGWAPTASWN